MDDAQGIANRVSTGLGDARTALDGAPRGKGADDDLDQLRADLSQAEASLSDARNSLNGGNAKAALEQAKAADSKLSSVQSAVQVAMKKIDDWQARNKPGTNSKVPAPPIIAKTGRRMLLSVFPYVDPPLSIHTTQRWAILSLLSFSVLISAQPLNADSVESLARQVADLEATLARIRGDDPYIVIDTARNRLTIRQKQLGRPYGDVRNWKWQGPFGKSR